jgi:hypothetical protein
VLYALALGTLSRERWGTQSMAIEVISDVRALRAGDIGFGPIPGVGGWAARAGMMILQDDTRYPHTFVVAGAALGLDIIEAMPGGAYYAMNVTDRWTSDFCYIRPDYVDQDQANGVVYRAMEMIGFPYGWMNYPYLSAKRLGIKASLIDNYVSAHTLDGYPKRPICSQLVDAALTMADFHTFDDGRLPQDVTPGDMFYGLLKCGPAAMGFPE